MNTRKLFLTLSMLILCSSFIHCGSQANSGPSTIPSLGNYFGEAIKIGFGVGAGIAGFACVIAISDYMHNHFFMSDKELLQRTQKSLDNSINFCSETLQLYMHELLLLDQELPEPERIQALKTLITQNNVFNRPYLAYGKKLNFTFDKAQEFENNLAWYGKKLNKRKAELVSERDSALRDSFTALLGRCAEHGLTFNLLIEQLKRLKSSLTGIPEYIWECNQAQWENLQNNVRDMQLHQWVHDTHYVTPVKPQQNITINVNQTSQQTTPNKPEASQHETQQNSGWEWENWNTDWMT